MFGVGWGGGRLTRAHVGRVCVQALCVCVFMVCFSVCMYARMCGGGGGGVRGCGWVRACMCGCTHMRVRLYARACVRQYSINSILTLASPVSPEVILCV